MLSCNLAPVSMTQMLAPVLSGFIPEHTDLRSYVPGRLSGTATIPPWYVSQGIGAVALSPPQAAAASTTQHDQTFMAPPAGRSPNAAHSSQTYGMVTQNDRTAGWADGSA